MTAEVLYIGGSGRTGSTFLSMLLAQNGDTCNIGQIRDLPAAIRREADCSCQRPLAQCSFWSQVTRKLAKPRALPRLAKGYSAFKEDARGNHEWNNAGLQARLRADHAAYLAGLSELYGAASEAAGGRMLIDSSKSPEQAYALSLTGTVTLYTLNLVRDPRAVAVSWSKRQSDIKRLRGQSREWRLRQKLFSRIGAAAPERFKLLRYEDLTAAPRDTIREILAWAGRDSSTANFTSGSEAKVSWDDLHLFPPANEGVLKARAEDITIKAADSWKDARHADLHRMAEEITFPAAERYGYTL
ncbi:sulfotransferase [Leisingera thetidis]|uniref:sulfotransferase n=1 Tax=Leisingera thetidis TaxID=2930199 RepID=UPI0021F71039|nr:sulfotransferase [Leisingera thetidis]